MLPKSIKSIIRGPFIRLKEHERPEFSTDFYRESYGKSPIQITGMWKVDHGHSLDYGSEQYDYEDHSVQLLHQRYTHYRWFWVVVLAWCSIPFFHFVWIEMPYPGTWFGIYNMDIEMNAIKYVNNDENKHDWDALKKRYDEIEDKEEEEEDGEQEEELIKSEEEQEAEKNENDKTEGKENQNEASSEGNSTEQSDSSSDDTSSEKDLEETEEAQSSSSESESSEESS